jgi:hypothetical protein
VLELTQTEESLLKLLLALADALVEVIPTAVDVGQRLLNGTGLGLGRLLREVACLSVERKGEIKLVFEFGNDTC